MENSIDPNNATGFDEESGEIEYFPDDENTETKFGRIRQRFEEEYLDVEGVQGFAESQNKIGDAALVIYVEHDGNKGELPTKFEGIDVVVRVVGEVRAQDD